MESATGKSADYGRTSAHLFTGRNELGERFTGSTHDKSLYDVISFYRCYSCHMIETYPIFLDVKHFTDDYEKTICRECLTQKERFAGRKIKTVNYPDDATDFIRNLSVKCNVKGCKTVLRVNQLHRHIIDQHATV